MDCIICEKKIERTERHITVKEGAIHDKCFKHIRRFMEAHPEYQKKEKGVKVCG